MVNVAGKENRTHPKPPNMREVLVKDVMAVCLLLENGLRFISNVCISPGQHRRHGLRLEPTCP